MPSGNWGLVQQILSSFTFAGRGSGVKDMDPLCAGATPDLLGYNYLRDASSAVSI